MSNKKDLSNKRQIEIVDKVLDVFGDYNMSPSQMLDTSMYLIVLLIQNICEFKGVNPIKVASEVASSINKNAVNLCNLQKKENQKAIRN